jgi:ketosteroid isomerase-like protein
MKAVVAILAALVCLGALFWFYTAPRAPVEMTKAEIAQIEAEVMEELLSVMDSVDDAFLRGDAGAVLSGYTTDARVNWSGSTLDRDELQDWAVGSFQAGTWTGVESRVMELFVHGDVAYAIWEWSGTRQMEGQESESVVLNCFSRFEKEDGVWKDDREVCNGPAEG